MLVVIGLVYCERKETEGTDVFLYLKDQASYFRPTVFESESDLKNGFKQIKEDQFWEIARQHSSDIHIATNDTAFNESIDEKVYRIDNELRVRMKDTTLVFRNTKRNKYKSMGTLNTSIVIGFRIFEEVGVFIISEDTVKKIYRYSSLGKISGCNFLFESVPSDGEFLLTFYTLTDRKELSPVFEEHVPWSTICLIEKDELIYGLGVSAKNMTKLFFALDKSVLKTKMGI